MPARLVAVKELQTGNASDMIAEALVMKDIPAHPNVVRLLGVCQEPPCMVTELVQNAMEMDKFLQGTLQVDGHLDEEEGHGKMTSPMATPRHDHALIDAEETPRLSRTGYGYTITALRILRGTARGLRHLHFHGIIHRDLAPRNILVNVRGRALLTDFGLSRSLNSQSNARESESAADALGFDPASPRGSTSSTTSSMHVIDSSKTYFRAAPENYGVTTFGQDIHTKKSDVFMLGMVIWESLAAKWGEITHTGKFRRGFLVAFQEAKGLPPGAGREFVTKPAEHGEEGKRGLAMMAAFLEVETLTVQNVEALVNLTVQCLQHDQAARCAPDLVCDVIKRVLTQQNVRISRCRSSLISADTDVESQRTLQEIAAVKSFSPGNSMFHSFAKPAMESKNSSSQGKPQVERHRDKPFEPMVVTM